MYDEKTARQVREPRPYYTDAYTTSFDARVTDRRHDERGHWVTLEHSYFYPESGGQEADAQTIAKWILGSPKALRSTFSISSSVRARPATRQVFLSKAPGTSRIFLPGFSRSVWIAKAL